MREIPLTQGKVAIVDDGDYERINEHKWYAWWNGNNWYAVRNRSRKKGVEGAYMIFMHREVIGAETGTWIDHRNRKTLDNRQENLRPATAVENGYNRRAQENNKSGYKGVYWDQTRQKWTAQIKGGGKRTTIGRFDDPVDAAKAYDKKARELHGEFAKTNF